MNTCLDITGTSGETHHFHLADPRKYADVPRLVIYLRSKDIASDHQMSIADLDETDAYLEYYASLKNCPATPSVIFSKGLAGEWVTAVYVAEDPASIESVYSDLMPGDGTTESDPAGNPSV